MFQAIIYDPRRNFTHYSSTFTSIQDANSWMNQNFQRGFQRRINQYKPWNEFIEAERILVSMGIPLNKIRHHTKTWFSRAWEKPTDKEICLRNFSSQSLANKIALMIRDEYEEYSIRRREKMAA